MNAEQHAAVVDRSPRVVVVAPPGSGKTTTLAAAIAYDCERSNPRDIVAITYTNSAAAEICERLKQSGHRVGFVGTLHAYCLQIIRQFHPAVTLVDEKEADKLLLEQAKAARFRGTSQSLEIARREFWKRSSVLGSHTAAESVVMNFAGELMRENLLEFDTVLAKAQQLIQRYPEKLNKIRWYVDEFQDSADIDFAIYNLHPHTRFFAVGDDDQSIYSFRGTNVRLISTLVHGDNHGDFKCSVHKLVTNYRSTPEIVDHTSRMMARAPDRLAKRIEANRKSGRLPVGYAAFSTAEQLRVICADIQELVLDGQPLEQIAVLTRTNAMAMEIRLGLEIAGLSVADTSLEVAPDMARVRTLVGLAAKPNSEVLRKICRSQAPEFNMWPKQPLLTAGGAIEYLKQVHAMSDPMQAIVDEAITEIGDHGPIDELLARLRPLPRQPGAGVQVGTVHWSKGREFDHVFMADCDMPLNTEPNAEERRLFYVGMTRARLGLTLVACAQRKNSFSRYPQPRVPLPFISEAGIPLQSI